MFISMAKTSNFPLPLACQRGSEKLWIFCRLFLTAVSTIKIFFVFSACKNIYSFGSTCLEGFILLAVLCRFSSDQS